MKVTYRLAAGGDSKAIADVFRITRETCLPYLPILHSADEDVAYFSTQVLPRDTVWVAEANHQIVGLCAFGEGWLNHLYVAPGFQNLRIGTELLAIAIHENEILDLWVFQQNTAAIKFYESHGFTLVKKTDGSENEEHVPDALYRYRRA